MTDNDDELITLNGLIQGDVHKWKLLLPHKVAIMKESYNVEFILISGDYIIIILYIVLDIENKR